jgi:triosephosphate isomerase (TIM)
LAVIVAANWKMNLRRRSAVALAARLAAEDGRGYWLFPAFPHLVEVAEAIRGSNLRLGSQDVSPHEDGAHTGEVSAGMLRDAGCQLALVGHSERRHGHGEVGTILSGKLRQVLAAGLAPLYCVGETLQERKDGRTEGVVAGQIATLAGLKPAERAGLCAVAYEPVWAIGTGVNATPAQAREMHAFVKARLKELGLGAAPVLYGGSVRPENARELLSLPGVDGVLVGGASLGYESLSAIGAHAAAVTKE